MLLADHLSTWDERAGSAAPIFVALALASLVALAAWVIRLRRHGVPDRGPGLVGVGLAFVVGLVVWLRLRGETDAFANLWNEIFLQKT